MSDFFQFKDAGRTTINLKYLSSVTRASRIAGRLDAEIPQSLFVEGQIIYSIRYSIVGSSSNVMEFISEQHRNNCYDEIMALIQPVLIGATPPADYKIPVFGLSKAAEKAQVTAVGGDSLQNPVSPKPPRKPRTPRQ